MSAVLFQINVTRDCNLRCTHCYISSDKKAASKTMLEDQFVQVFEQIRDFMISDFNGNRKYQLADIHVIGGEPTMLGYEFYERTISKVKAILSDIPQQYQLCLVSNLITPEALKIARLFDIISTSYEIDTRFVSASGKAKPALEKKWVENVKALKEDGPEVNVTMAVTKQAVDFGAANILDYFFSNGFRGIHLGFFIPSGDGLIYIDSVFPLFEETTQFMIEATNWYLERRMVHKDLWVNPIESMIESIYHNKPMDDIVCPIIPGSLDIDWDGSTVTCIEAGGEIDAKSLGNVFYSSISEIMKSREYRRARNNAVVPNPNCIGCDELKSCQSACGVLHQYWNGKGECPGFKGFIKHIRSLVEVHGVKPKTLLLENEHRKRTLGC